MRINLLLLNFAVPRQKKLRNTGLHIRDNLNKKITFINIESVTAN